MSDPLAVDPFADQVRNGLDMTAGEKNRRMAGMRNKVERKNVFRWAGHIPEERKKPR